MQHQTQYFRTVPVSERFPGENPRLIVRESDTGHLVHPEFLFNNRNTLPLDKYEWLEPIALPDAERLRDALEKIVKDVSAVIPERIPVDDKLLVLLYNVKWTAQQALSAVGDGWVRVEDGLPESGKSVLMYWKNSMGFGRISKGFYAAKFSVVDDNEENHDGYSEYSEEKDEYYYPEGWVEAGWETQYSATIKGVTHWQYAPKEPLPPQPINK